MKENSKQKKPEFDVVSLVDDILRQAIAAGASDVHFEPGRSEMLVKFRLDGVLNAIETLPGAIGENIVARLKVLGGLLTYRNDIPQEGRIELTGEVYGEVIDQRLSIFPTIHGQRAVVRLFYAQKELDNLESLGFSDYALSTMQQIAGRNQGVLLLTGPAGSGKTTTLAALLRHILTTAPGKSIVALEDPVERHIDGVTQVQVSANGQMTFPTALRSLLRQDPEVLMIGEIRDAETARIVIEAGLTGHLLMSTMHSGTPAGGLIRLLEMGIEPYQITSSITAVLNQRLLRRLCEHCKKQITNDGTFEPVGCDMCFNTGYKGRVLIAEMVELDGELRQAILAKADMERLETILKNRGHINMAQSGMQLVRKGLTTVSEVNLV